MNNKDLFDLICTLKLLQSVQSEESRQSELPQSLSSEESKQSGLPLHLNSWLMQAPSSHLNSFGKQVRSANDDKVVHVYIIY